ncbi:MAG: hypothetical protein NVS2B6_06830 [Thermoleophilaceae bacterium]
MRGRGLGAGKEGGGAPPPAARAWGLAASAALAVLALDQLTKAVVRRTLRPEEHVNVFFGIDLTNVRNKGVAFGALAGSGWVVPALTIAAVVGLVIYFARHSATPRLWLPVGVVAGGAFGNLLDRAREGSVTDFVAPSFWPAFNVADAGIVLGVLGVLYVVEGATRATARPSAG